MVPVAGGVPVRRDGYVAAAPAVSGGSEAQDVACAQGGARPLVLQPNPGRLRSAAAQRANAKCSVRSAPCDGSPWIARERC